jgi:uncharacterized protein with PQ loop repeat
MTREELAQKIYWRKAIWLVGIINPMFMLPQLLQLWTTRVTDGLSVITLILLFLVQAGFSTHGFFLRDKPLLISNGIAATVTFLVLVSTIIFRLS